MFIFFRLYRTLIQTFFGICYNCSEMHQIRSTTVSNQAVATGSRCELSRNHLQHQYRTKSFAHPKYPPSFVSCICTRFARYAAITGDHVGRRSDPKTTCSGRSTSVSECARPHSVQSREDLLKNVPRQYGLEPKFNRKSKKKLPALKAVPKSGGEGKQLACTSGYSVPLFYPVFDGSNFPWANPLNSMAMVAAVTASFQEQQQQSKTSFGDSK